MAEARRVAVQENGQLPASEPASKPFPAQFDIHAQILPRTLLAAASPLMVPLKQRVPPGLGTKSTPGPPSRSLQVAPNVTVPERIGRPDSVGGLGRPLSMDGTLYPKLPKFALVLH